MFSMEKAPLLLPRRLKNYKAFFVQFKGLVDNIRQGLWPLQMLRLNRSNKIVMFDI